MRRALLALLLSFGVGCTCVTKKDYQALLEASEEYYATVSPTFRADVEKKGSTGELASLSVTNRLKADTLFREALASSRARLEGAPVASK